MSRFIVLIFFCHFFVFTILSCNNGTNTPSTSNSGPVSYLNDTTLDKRKFKAAQKIFVRYCHQCHQLPGESESTLFYSVINRNEEPEKYFIEYISDSRKLKKSGDSAALQVDKEYNVDYEHEFKDSLSQEEMNDLIFYMKKVVSGEYKFLAQ